MEIVAPYPHAKAEIGRLVTEMVEKNGEGMHSVENAEKTRAPTERMGIRIVGHEKWSEDIIRANYDNTADKCRRSRGFTTHNIHNNSRW